MPSITVPARCAGDVCPLFCLSVCCLCMHFDLLCHNSDCLCVVSSSYAAAQKTEYTMLVTASTPALLFVDCWINCQTQMHSHTDGFVLMMQGPCSLTDGEAYEGLSHNFGIVLSSKWDAIYALLAIVFIWRCLHAAVLYMRVRLFW